MELFSPRDPRAARLFGGGQRTKAGVTVNEHTALGHTAVWKGVNVISNSVAKIPVACYQRGKDGSRIFDATHPANRLLRNEPCPNFTPFLFRQVVQAHALLAGNGFAYIFRDNAARPVELAILDPSRTVVLKARESLGEIPRGAKVFLTNIGGQNRYLLNEDVIHIHGLGYDGLSGYSVVDLLREAIGHGIAMRQFGASFFGNGANASGIVEIPEGWSEAAWKSFRESFDKQYAGLGNAQRVMMLESGAKFTPVTVSPEQAQFLQSREFDIREIANVLCVSAHKLGDASRKSYNSLEQSNQEFLDDDIDPWLIRWEQELKAKLLTEKQKADDSHYIEFERKALMRMDAATRSAFYVSGRQWGWLSANEIRAAENMEGIGPDGDMYLVPINMQPAEEANSVVRPDFRKKAPDDNAAAVDPRFQALVAADLRGIAERLCKQATAKRKLGEAAYAAWVDSIDEKQGPPEIHEFSVPMVRDLKNNLKDGPTE